MNKNKDENVEQMKEQEVHNKNEIKQQRKESLMDKFKEFMNNLIINDRQEVHQDHHHIPVSKHIFHFIDFVQNRVRTRILSILPFFFTLIILFVYVLEMTLYNPVIDNSINVEIGANSIYHIGVPINESQVAPKIHISHYTSSNKLQINFTNFIQSNTKFAPDCSSENIIDIYGFFLFIKYLDPCNIQYNYTDFQINRFNRLSLNDLNFYKINKGLYTYNYLFKFKNNSTQSQQTFLDSNLATIIPLNDPEASISSNTLFNPQPILQLVDSLNNPLSNKYVSAFTWPEYSFSETTNDYFIDPIKLGLLENAIIITDNEGYAKFKSLKFLGSSSSNIYIMFTCDGITSSVWSTKVNSFRITYGIPQYIPPILIVSKVQSIKILSSLSIQTQELQTINPIKVQILDENGNGVPNKWAIIICVGDSITKTSPFNYRTIQLGQKIKSTLFGYPGKFQTINQIYTSSSQYQASFSDNEGILTFNNVQMTQDGVSGGYFLEIHCDGIKSSDQIEINVESQVSKLNVLEWPGSTFTFGSDSETNFNVLFQVLNTQGNGIKGKIPNFSIVNALTNKKVTSDELSIQINPYDPSYQLSNQYGIGKMTFLIYFVKNPIIVYIKLKLESVTVTSSNITLVVGNAPISPGISYLTQNSLQTTNQISFIALDSESYQVGQNLSVVVQSTQKNQVLSNAVVEASLIFKTNQITETPESITPTLKNYIQITDQNGIANFNSLKILNLAWGLYQIQFTIKMTQNTISQSPILENSKSININLNQRKLTISCSSYENSSNCLANNQQYSLNCMWVNGVCNDFGCRNLISEQQCLSVQGCAFYGNACSRDCKTVSQAVCQNEVEWNSDFKYFCQIEGNACSQRCINLSESNCSQNFECMFYQSKCQILNCSILLDQTTCISFQHCTMNDTCQRECVALPQSQCNIEPNCLFSWMENECKTRSDINCTDFGEESCLFSKLSVNLKCFWDEMNAECISEALNTEQNTQSSETESTLSFSQIQSQLNQGETFLGPLAIIVENKIIKSLKVINSTSDQESGWWQRIDFEVVLMENVIFNPQIQPTLKLNMIDFPAYLVPQIYDPIQKTKRVENLVSLGIVQLDKTQIKLNTKTVNNEVQINAGPIYFKIQYGNYGKYKYSLAVKGMVSQPIEFNTDQPKMKINLISQPQSNYNIDQGSISFIHVGQFVGHFVVTVTDSNNNALSNVPIFLSLDEISADSEHHNALLDINSSEGENSPFFIFAQFRLLYSDQEGQCQFTQVTVVDVYQNACVRFIFKTDLKFTSVPTNLYCFQNKYSLQLDPTNIYSRVISSNFQFQIPIKVILTFPIATSLQNSEAGFFLINASPSKLNDEYVQNPFKVSPNYLNNQNCVGFYDKSISSNMWQPTIGQQCFYKLKRQGTVLQIQIRFDSLYWVGQSDNMKIIIQIGSALQNQAEQESYNFENLEQSNLDTVKDYIELLRISKQDISFIIQQYQVIEQMIEQINLSLINFGFKPVDQMSKVNEKIDNLKNSIITVFQSNSLIIKTNPIVVSSLPYSIQFITQPPRKVYIGQLFSVTVQCIGASLIGLQNQNIEMNIIPVLSQAESQQQTINLIQSLKSSQRIELNYLAQVTQSITNIQIEQSRKSSLTDSKGNANFVLNLPAGLSGIYNLQAQATSNGIYSSQSIQFQVVNPLQSLITLSEKISTHHSTIPYNPSGISTINLGLQIPLQIQSHKQIQLNVFVSSSIYQYTPNNFNQLMIQLQKDSSEALQNSYSVTEIISQLIQFIFQSQSPTDVFLPLDVEQQVIFAETSSQIMIEQINILVEGTASYIVLPTVNGINLKDIYIVNFVAPDEDYSVHLQKIFGFIFLFLGFFASLIGNQSNSIIYILISGILFEFIAFVLFSANVNDNKGLYGTIIFCSMALMIIQFKTIFICYLDNKHIMEYNNKFEPYTFDSLKNLFFRLYLKSFLKQSTREQSTSNQNKANPSNCKRFSFPKYLIPFQFTIGNQDPIQNFYYPTKLVVAVSLTLGALLFLTIIIVNVLLTIQNSIDQLMDNTITSFYTFINFSVTKLVNIGVYSGIGEDQFNSLQTPLIQVEGQLKYLKIAIVGSFAFSITICLGVKLVAQFLLLRDFKIKLLDLRKGTYKSVKKEWMKSLELAPFFIGLYLSSSILSYFLSLILVALFLIPMFHPLFYQLLYEQKLIIFILVLLFYLNHEIKEWPQRINLGRNYIIHRIYYPIFEFIQIFTSIGTGIFYGVLRFLLAFIFGVLIGSSFAHLSLETEWIVNWRGNNDVMYKSYLAIVSEYHYNNNPICQGFIHHLLKTNLRSRNGPQRDLILRNKLRLCLLFNKNPELHSLRKRNVVYFNKLPKLKDTIQKDPQVEQKKVNKQEQKHDLSYQSHQLHNDSIQQQKVSKIGSKPKGSRFQKNPQPNQPSHLSKFANEK